MKQDVRREKPTKKMMMPASRTAQMEKGKAVKWKIDLTLLSLLVGHDNGCFIDSIISQKQTMRPSTSNSLQDFCGKGADRTTEHEPAMEPAVMEPAYPWPYNYALFQTIQGTKTAMIELCDTDSKRSQKLLLLGRTQRAHGPSSSHESSKQATRNHKSSKLGSKMESI